MIDSDLIEEMSGDRDGHVPAARFLLDGIEHHRGDRCHDRCACGGTLHGQGVYGSYFRLCDQCGARP